MAPHLCIMAVAHGGAVVQRAEWTPTTLPGLQETAGQGQTHRAHPGVTGRTAASGQRAAAAVPGAAGRRAARPGGSRSRSPLCAGAGAGAGSCPPPAAPPGESPMAPRPPTAASRCLPKFCGLGVYRIQSGIQWEEGKCRSKSRSWLMC